MAGRRTVARQRTAIAVALSMAGHAAILALIVFDLHREPVEPETPYFVEISLTRPERPVEREALLDEPVAATPSVRRPAVAPAILPSAIPGPQAPVAEADRPSAAPAEEFPTALHTGCVGRRGQDTKARVDCKLEIWSFLDGRPVGELPGDTIPDDKRVEYAATAARQAAKRRPIAAMGNGSSMGCVQSNLGAGCVDDMAIPLFSTGPKK